MAWNGRSVRDTFIKMPAIDAINLVEQTLPVDALSQLFVEDIGGVELSQVTNYQTIFGTNIAYKTIAELDNITNEYNPGRYLLNRRGSFQQGLDYNDYYEGYTVLANGDIELNFGDLPDGVMVEVEMDSNAIINIQEQT